VFIVKPRIIGSPFAGQAAIQDQQDGPRGQDGRPTGISPHHLFVWLIIARSWKMNPCYYVAGNHSLLIVTLISTDIRACPLRDLRESVERSCKIMHLSSTYIIKKNRKHPILRQIPSSISTASV
jgi:hypothetical protein